MVGALAGLLFMVLGVPSNGAAFGPEFVPPVYSWIAGVLPTDAAITLIRRIGYFAHTTPAPR